MSKDIYIPLHTADKEPISAEDVTFPYCRSSGKVRLYNPVTDTWLEVDSPIEVDSSAGSITVEVV